MLYANVLLSSLKTGVKGISRQFSLVSSPVLIRIGLVSTSSHLTPRGRKIPGRTLPPSLTWICYAPHDRLVLVSPNLLKTWFIFCIPFSRSILVSIIMDLSSAYKDLSKGKSITDSEWIWIDRPEKTNPVLFWIEGKKLASKGLPPWPFFATWKWRLKKVGAPVHPCSKPVV